MTAQHFHSTLSTSFMSNRDLYAVIEDVEKIVGQDNYQINTDADKDKVIVEVDGTAVAIHDAPNGGKITVEQMVRLVQDHIDGGYVVVYAETLNNDGRVISATLDMVGGSLPTHFSEVISYRMDGAEPLKADKVVEERPAVTADDLAYMAGSFGVLTGKHDRDSITRRRVA